MTARGEPHLLLPVCADHLTRRCEIGFPTLAQNRCIPCAWSKPLISLCASGAGWWAGNRAAHTCKMGLEGIVSKRKDSRYRSGRAPDWLRMKNPNAPEVTREAEEDWGETVTYSRYLWLGNPHSE